MKWNRVLENILLGFLVIGTLIAALVRSVSSGAKHKARADQAERELQNARGANEIKNRVATDDDYRERVRRQFDEGA